MADANVKAKTKLREIHLQKKVRGMVKRTSSPEECQGTQVGDKVYYKLEREGGGWSKLNRNKNKFWE